MEIFKKRYVLFIFPIISFLGGLWQGQFTYDGYHWGFMLSNALDLIDGKIPYKEIFIEYGILGTVIHALALITFDKNILSLVAITCFLYSLTILTIALIIEKITLNKYYSFISTIVIFMIYPWPVTPWPNFISFFFTTIFCYFYLKNGNKYSVLSGITLALAYLTFTTVYNFIIIFFLLISFTFILINYKSIGKNFIKKNVNVLLSFLLIITIFFIYLIFNNLFNIWINYQKIPFIMAQTYEIGIINKILNYFYFLFVYSWQNFIYEPQIFFYTILFIANIFLIINIYVDFYKNKDFSELKLKLFIISIMILSLNFYAQLSDIDKLSTSLLLSIISLFYYFNKIKSIDNKIIVNTIIIFISLYSFLFAFGLEYSKNGASRSAYYKDLKNIELKYKNKDTKYFVSQKWTKNMWHEINSFQNFQKKIKKCKLEYGVNLTSNTYYYALLDNRKMQVIPFFYKDLGKIFRSYFDKNLLKKIQKEIDNENILIVTSENNDKLINLKLYSAPKKIDINKYKEKITKYIYIYYPKKCKII